MSEQTVDMSLAALTELVERHRQMLHQWEEREQGIDTLISAAMRLVGRQVIAENREALDALAELDDSGDYGDFKRQLLRDPATREAYAGVDEETTMRLAGLEAMLDEIEEWSRQVQGAAATLVKRVAGRRYSGRHEQAAPVQRPSLHVYATVSSVAKQQQGGTLWIEWDSHAHIEDGIPLRDDQVELWGGLIGKQVELVIAPIIREEPRMPRLYYAPGSGRLTSDPPDKEAEQ